MSRHPVGKNPEPYVIPVWAQVRGQGFSGYVVERPGPYSVRVRRKGDSDLIVPVSLIEEWKNPSPAAVRIMTQLEEEKRGAPHGQKPEEGDA